MSQVTPQDVSKIAHLSKLNLEGSELEKMTGEFNQILEYVKQLNEVNTENVDPLGHVLELENVTRKDEPGKSLHLDDLKAIAPEFNAGYFVVPRVIES